MKWAQVNKAHFNLDLILAFHWRGGKLFIYWLGEDGPDTYPDPDRSNYMSLCLAAGVAPLKEDADGKS